MHALRSLLHFTVAIAAAAAGATYAAGVVVTPGTNAGYMYFPSGITGTGGGSGSGPVETLETCRVTPTDSTRTISLASRNWYGHTKPVTVYYKMVGGGAGVGNRPQLAAAGGSTAILKNGVLVAVAPGMNAGATARSPINGSFTVTAADTLQFILGGGGGGSGAGSYLYARQICEPDADGNTYCYNQWESYGTGVGGGGGAGYYGGGSGSYQANVLGGLPTQSPVAFGGTGTAGGAGFVAGSLNRGGGSGGPAGGGNGNSTGANVAWSYWTGFTNASSLAGGGGAFGRLGNAGGQVSSAAPITCTFVTGAQTFPPTATIFELSNNAGQPGSALGGLYDPANGCTQPGGGYGEIVLQYQARTCDLIPQYNQN